MAITIDRFFRIYQFYLDNPHLKSVCPRDGEIYDGWIPTCPVHNIPMQQSTLPKVLANELLANPDVTKAYQNIIKFDPVYGLSYTNDMNTVNNALNARDKVRNYFGNVIVPGSYAYNTKDMDLFRRMVVDWSAANRTMKDEMLKSTNAFSLDDIDVDKAIKGFGIDFFNKDTLDNLTNRQAFLLAMTNLYKIKGTPQSIISSLQYANVSNAIIREYWVDRNPYAYKDLRIRGVAALQDQQRFNPITQQYEFLMDPTYYADTFLSWENFQSRLWDIGDPHWWYTNEEITAIEYDPDTWMKLPSITPYFGVEFYPDIEKYNTVMSMLEKIMSDQFNSILSGNVNLIPQEIGVDGYNEGLSEKDLWIKGYDQPISLLECFLGFVYSQVRYDEYVRYTQLKNFLEDHRIEVPDSVYQYPWAYQELIYWAWLKKDETIDGVITIDSVLRMYVREKSNYYLSTNELVKWWVERPLVSGETAPHTESNIPTVFFDIAYDFKFNPEQTDTTLDQILYYSGQRKLDFKTPPFEYFETLADSDRDANQETVRLSWDDDFKSYHPANRVNNYFELTNDAQHKYLTTYYDYVSWIAPNYLETETHDGSSITPFYTAKYPKYIQWNWGIDDTYLYVCKSPTKWIRSAHQSSWVGGAVSPTDGPLDVTDTDQLGYQFYYDNYMYKYVSNDTWVRTAVETTWDYCDCDIIDDGTIKLDSDLSRKHIKAQVSESIADKYINDKDSLGIIEFTITLDPLGNPETRKFDLAKFEEFISTFQLTVRSDGYLLIDFDHFYDDEEVFVLGVSHSYLYIRLPVFDTTDTVQWVRKLMVNEWTTNGIAMYEGEYKYPNLDLTNRYDAERILRGEYVLESSELEDLPGTTNDGQILVAKGLAGYPEVWEWNDTLSSWVKSLTNIVDQINLGFNDGLIEWMDTTAVEESDYEDIADKMIKSLSAYVKVTFRDSDFDIAAIYKDISNSGLYKDLINFFKPKRARLLYFSINLNFDDRLFNSLILDDKPEASKMLQQINDHVPRNDTQYIENERGMWKKSYHEDDSEKSWIAPSGSDFYASGFEDERFNGFYFPRTDLSVDDQPYYLNNHNIALTKVKQETKIWGYKEEWILGFRKNDLTWCDATYVNYDENPLDWRDNLDQSQENQDGNGGDLWSAQSFTAGISGFLTRIDVKFTPNPLFNGTNQLWLRVYQGDGITGSLLYEEYIGNNYTGDWNAFYLGELIEVTSGSQYTWQLEAGEGNPKKVWLVAQVNGTYTGGHWWLPSGSYPNIDGTFKTYVAVSGLWHTPTEDPAITPTTFRFFVDADSVHITLRRESDYTTDVDLTPYVMNKEDNWNTIYTRPDAYDSDYGVTNLPSPWFKTDRLESQSLTQWPYAVCKDPYNMRSVFPVGTEKQLETIITNYGFENDFSGWNVSAETGGNPHIDTVIFYAGTKSCRFDVVASAFHFNTYSIEAELFDVDDILPGDQLVVTAAIRNDIAGAMTYNGIYFKYGAGASDYLITESTTIGSWELVEGRFVVPLDWDKPTNFELKLIILSAGGAGSIYYDNVQLTIEKPTTNSKILGYPENITGARTSGYNGDARNSENYEEQHSFWRTYPYVDDMIIKDAATPVLTRTTVAGGTFYSPSEFNAPYLYEKKIGTGDAITTKFWINLRDLPLTYITIYVDDVAIPSANYTITETYIEFTAPPALNADITYKSTFPVWWVKLPAEFYSGPVHHRPIYMGINNIIHDCYPCRPWSECCDYYDVGCEHDGPSNPRDVVWNPDTGEWEAGVYSAFSVLDLHYDVNTHYHNVLGFITDPVEQEKYGGVWDPVHRVQIGGEASWTGELINPGDTFCTPCDDPLFTPDVAYFNIPEEYKLSGVYHNNITGTGFDDATFNTNWSAGNITRATNNDFPVGYINDSDNDYEMVHVFHKPSGYHYWEIRAIAGAYSSSSSSAGHDVILRTKLKEKLHTLDDIIDENIGNWHVEPNNFLNGNDVDVAEDKWCDASLDPDTDFVEVRDDIDDSPYVPGSPGGKSVADIAQVLVTGRMETSTWTRFPLETYSKSSSSPFYEAKFGYLGEINYNPADQKVYICVEADYINHVYNWKRSSITADDTWTVVSEPYIRPGDDNNYYGYFYRNNYMYLYISTTQHAGWIRISVTQSVPTGDLSGYASNQWNLNITNWAYRLVSNIDTFPNTPADEDEMYVCGNVVPYLETFAGIWAVLKKFRCECTINEIVEYYTYEYDVKLTGAYIKIKSTIPVTPDSRKEHRFITHNGDPTAAILAINNWTVDELEHYTYKNYLPISIGATWERDGTDFYERRTSFLPSSSSSSSAP